MWFSSFSGLTSFDTEKKIFTIHHHPYLNSASFALAVDSLDRLWVGTGSSLLVLDSSRTKFARFGVKEGLPAQEFLEQKSYTTAAGAFILGTQNGFVSFNPLDYATEKRLLNVYIGAYYENGLEKNMPKYDEDAKVRIELSANDNVLNLQLTAINFLNSEQTWYAYKLEGLEGNWHFTQDPKVIYINLPGGNYIFKYKATINPNDWDMPEKSVPIFVETVFYKSWWFWLFILVDIILVVYFLYRRQTTQRKQVFDLLSRAQALEKEKAVMQYEGLKQQLNPHFLFNSLTSLSSLIQIDPSVASRFLDNLSKTYRYILKSSESETVFLRDEIRFTQNFVALQKVRFETGLEVYFDIQEADLDKKVVPVTIQNMIENAIKHNIIDDESPLKILIYTTDTEGGYLIIKNNLQKKNFVESSNKRGLNNLTSLYKYFSNRSVEARENQDSFTVKIPLL